MTPDAIRYYERVGLLPPPRRAVNGYRDYGPESEEDILFIRKAQVLGLTLDDIREVLEIASGGKPPCEHIRRTVTERLAEIDRRLRELRTLRNTLRETLNRLDRAPPAQAGCRCAVIESV